MPPQRAPLAETSSNRKDYKHFSPYMRGKIVGCQIGGQTPAQIAVSLKVYRTTVDYTIATDLLRHEGNSLSRKVRRKSYSKAEERLLLRHVRLNPKDTYAEVKRVCGLGYSRSTIKKILKEHSI